MFRRRRWPLVVPLAVFAGWGLARLVGTNREPSAEATGGPRPTLVSFQAPTGERLTGARCWMVVIDESGSMSTADALGARADSVRAAGEFLAAYGLPDDRIGVTWFAERATATDPREPSPNAISPRAPSGLGDATMISTALSTALQSMDRTCGEARRVIVLASDGQATSAAEFAATSAAIAASRGDTSVHLVALNGGGAFESARTFWEDPALGLASVRTVDTFDGDEVAAAVAGILSAETGQRVTAR